MQPLVAPRQNENGVAYLGFPPVEPGPRQNDFGNSTRLTSV
jgi:hypothetical protein